MNYVAKLLMNSLYGRFGMRDEFHQIRVLSIKEFNKFISLVGNLNLTRDIIKLDEHFLVQTDQTSNQTRNINIAIAAAITAHARIFMSKFKNHPNLKLFYTDTDSIHCNLSPDQMMKLFPRMVSSTGLGKLKLESVAKRAIYLAPKCYILETISGETICKVKGLTQAVVTNFNEFEQLLVKDSFIKKTQTKWYKSLSEGTIRVLEQTYTLQQTHNKRELVYADNKLIGTRPYVINPEKKK